MPAYPTDQFPSTLTTDTCKIRHVTSSSKIAIPIEQGANHLLGHGMRGMMGAAMADGAAGTENGSLYVICERHQNTLWLGLWAYCDKPTSGPGDITVTAGSGVAKTVVVDAAGEYLIAAPWAPGDSGVQIVEIAMTDAPIRSYALMELPRSSLVTTTDKLIEPRSTTKPRIGLYEGDAIAERAFAGVDGLIQGCDDAHELTRRQIFNWSAVDGLAWKSTTKGNIFGDDQKWYSYGRQFYDVAGSKGPTGDGISYRNCECYIYVDGDVDSALDQFLFEITDGTNAVSRTLLGSEASGKTLIQITNSSKWPLSTSNIAYWFEADAAWNGGGEGGPLESWDVYAIAVFEDAVP